MASKKKSSRAKRRSAPAAETTETEKPAELKKPAGPEPVGSSSRASTRVRPVGSGARIQYH